MAGKSDGQSRIESVVDGSMNQPANQPAAPKRVIHLYFADENGRYLKAEQRVMRQPEDDAALVRQLVDALIRGPDDNAGRTLPVNARMNSAFVLNDGRAVLDFSTDAFKDMPGGVGTELLAVYSIVNTLVFNVDSIQAVKILIGGREARSLAGHVNIQQPFRANMLWVR